MTDKNDPLRLLVGAIFDYNTSRELAIRNTRLAHQAKRENNTEKFNSHRLAAISFNLLCKLAHDDIYTIVSLLSKKTMDDYLETMGLTLGVNNQTPAMVHLRKCIEHLNNRAELPFESLIKSL